MAGITRALVSRHALGRADAFDAALLDVAQDHLLFLLDAAGMFTNERLTFKGGTSLRKCRLGNDGRFSTDLDFAAPDDDVVLEVCDVIHDSNRRRLHLHSSTRHAVMVATGSSPSPTTNSAPRTSKPASSSPADPSPSPLQQLPFVPLPIHRNYGFELPTLPIVAEAEACAEKLARYRRVALAATSTT